MRYQSRIIAPIPASPPHGFAKPDPGRCRGLAVHLRAFAPGRCYGPAAPHHIDRQTGPAPNESSNKTLAIREDSLIAADSGHLTGSSVPETFAESEDRQTCDVRGRA